MEGVRSISIAYYDRATKGEKELVKQYFDKFNVNGDGKITLQQYKNGVANHLSDDGIFRRLDTDGDGLLDFDGIACAYYMETKLGLHKCAACPDLLVGAYFSCLICVQNGLDPECRLCCTCYHLGVFSHGHSLSNFLDQHTMAKVLKNQATRRKKEFEDLRQIATSYYLAGSEEVKDLALKFFRSMDTDGDGKVDRMEFQEFMREEGYTRMQDPKFFSELDVDGDGSLDFDEVKTAYYIYRSGRPFCDGDKCGKFILGIYFSCVDCYKNPKDSFNLCLDCYSSRKCDHKHDGRRAQFLDNFAMLEAMKLDSSKQAKTTSTDQPLNQARSPAVSSNDSKPRAPATQTKSPFVPSSSTQPQSPISSYHHTYTAVPAANYTTNVIYNTYVANPPPAVTSYYQGAVIHPPPRRNQWRSALRALETALAIGSIAMTTTCAIM